MKEKTMFETLPNYERGFYGRAGKTEADSYRAESERIKARITAGTEPLEEIIWDEQQRAEKAQLRASFTDDGGAAAEKAQGYRCAVELIKSSLTDSKPL